MDPPAALPFGTGVQNENSNELITLKQPFDFMFILLLHYKKPLADVDAQLQAHKAYLAKHYATGSFLLSGRKEPRTGGVILADAPDRETLDAVIAEDPFVTTGVADYEIIAFEPSMFRDDLKTILATPAV